MITHPLLPRLNPNCHYAHIGRHWHDLRRANDYVP